MSTVVDHNTDAAINPATGRLGFAQSGGWSSVQPQFLQGLRVDRYQVTFALHRGVAGTPWSRLVWAFNATDGDDYDYVEIWHHNTAGYAPYASQRVNGARATSVSGTAYPANCPAATDSDVLWVRITDDGTTVRVKEVLNNPSLLDSASDAWVSAAHAFDNQGGLVGFTCSGYYPAIDDLTIQSDRDGDGTYETTEHVDHFTVDSAGYAPQGVTYDQAGNLTYDGVYACHYDAWNRLVTVAKAFRESTPDGNGGVTLGSLQEGSTVHLSSYDGLNRRIEKQVQNSADLDCTYHYYYDVNWRILETRNGSDETLQQMVWAPLNSPGGGTGYTDELVQIATNGAPSQSQECDLGAGAAWVCQDANYNVLGLIDQDARILERYEYTPYGQRTVFMSTGYNDGGSYYPKCYAPTLLSQRVEGETSGVFQPYGLNPFGHQGLLHEEELANGAVIQNRNRILFADYGLLGQRDPAGYKDGPNAYAYLRQRPTIAVDPSGLASSLIDVKNGLLSYSCNGGWIDWTHVASQTMGLWTRINSSNNLVSEEGGGYKVNAYLNQTITSYKLFPNGKSQNYYVKSGLSILEKKSVALGIWLEMTQRFENYQGAFIVGLASGHSSNSEGDLPSNFIGFYEEVNQIPRSVTKAKFGVLDPVASECIWWDIYHSSTNYLPKVKYQMAGHHWDPILHHKHSTSAIFHCLNQPKVWPSEFDQIAPSPKGGLYRDWKVGVVGDETIGVYP